MIPSVVWIPQALVRLVNKFRLKIRHPQETNLEKLNTILSQLHLPGSKSAVLRSKLHWFIIYPTRITGISHFLPPKLIRQNAGPRMPGDSGLSWRFANHGRKCRSHTRHWPRRGNAWPVPRLSGYYSLRVRI